MKVVNTRTAQDSMNLIAETEGLTFNEALSAYADKVVAEREAEAKAETETKTKASK